MWQPIETAPRNQNFLAVINCAGEQTICTMHWPVAEAKNSRPEVWGRHVERVTHWMPLPDLPGAQAQPAPSVPTESIGKMLAQVMEAAVANGANSVSMPDELVEVAAWLSGAQPNPANGQTRAVRDVIAERRRQIEVEGWAPEHDDRHGAHELAEAAACYCLSSAGKPFDYFETMWPWERWWFKVSDPRRDLVKAGALVLAEIERLDRAAAPKPEGE